MPAVDAIIQHGNLPSAATLVDEANLLITSMTVTPAREKKDFKGTNRAIQGISYTNPTLAFDIKAYIGTADGFATQHPGTAVTELANYAGARHGFSADQGTMIYEDPTDDFSNDDPDKISFKVVQYPFVVNV